MARVLDLGPRRHPRRMSLTPMIDVVFLLLIFFMLASRFGIDAVLPIQGAAGGAGAAEWQGAPRLVDIAPDALRLNGEPVPPEALAARLSALMPSDEAPVILRPREGADLQRLVSVIGDLRRAGFTALVVVD